MNVLPIRDEVLEGMARKMRLKYTMGIELSSAPCAWMDDANCALNSAPLQAILAEAAAALEGAMGLIDPRIDVLAQAVALSALKALVKP